MKHNSTKDMMFYFLQHQIDYSKKWEDVEIEMGYNLGDFMFENKEAYGLIRQAVKHLWVIFNGKLNSKGEIE